MLAKVKLALRIATNEYDTELTALINAAKVDLQIAGVILPTTLDEIVEEAIKTYCKIHFLDLTDGEYKRLKDSYDEQKAQLYTATGYTNWGTV